MRSIATLADLGCKAARLDERRKERWRSGLLLLGLAFLLLAPELLSASAVRTLQLATLLGLVALGINLTFGFGGQLALSHVFFYAAAAYATGILATKGTTNLLLVLLVGVALAVLCALVTGVAALRLSSWSLALTSFFLVTLVPEILQVNSDLTGGLAGLVGIPRLTLGEPLDTAALYRVSILFLGFWLLFQRRFIYSAYGRMLAVLRHDEVQVATLGASTFELKLLAYVLSAIPAGLAGVSFATLDGFLSPQSFTLNQVILVLAAIVIGGQGTLYGPFLGVLILVGSQVRFQSFETYTVLVYGVFLVAIAVLIPGGLIGTAAKAFKSWRRPYLGANRVESREGEGEAVPLGPAERADFTAGGVARRFGGVQALAGVSLHASAGEVTALVGPNGSGKTTFLNAVSGLIRLDGGALRLGDRHLDRLSAPRIVRAGVGRTFQTPSIPEGLTVREAVSTAAFAGRRSGLVSTLLRLPRWRRAEETIARRVDEVLRELELSTDAEALAVEMPLGKKRLVEIARAVMTRPALLLLDEAASGLSPHETEALGELLRRLAGEGTTILLVEHNMNLVLSVADRVTVLTSGQVLASGDPTEVASDSRVVTAYLGEDPTHSEELTT